MISIIVAIAENYAIGKNNDLLWYIPEDLKRFKRLTLGFPVIMGKKTWLSLPRRPLPGRTNIVITDVPSESFEGCRMAYSIEEALKMADPGTENFIIGGATIYTQFFPYADRLYLTRVHKPFEADVFFPQIDFRQWELVSKEDVPFDETVGFSFAYETYDRIRNSGK